MTATQCHRRQAGFTIAELLVSSTIFLLMAAATFSLLNQSQQRYKTDSQILTSFQEARLGLDQIQRDINDSGFPPINHFFGATPPVNLYAVSPVAWSPTYPGTPCTITVSCTTPGDFDLIVETDYDNTGVKWIRYQLTGTTLFRGVAPKTIGGDPATATSAAGVMVPYVTNVMNNASGAQIGTFRSYYPTMFPGATAQPIFQYTCDTAAGPTLCSAAGASNSPQNVRDVEITLIVQTLQVDVETRAPRLVELSGRGHRVNPNQ
jgi:type II secretory pathway pseudopilin PulG